MANQEHVDILKQGVEVWNKWREEHSDIEPDLNGINLSDVNLSEVNLRSSDLSSARLASVNLSSADLTGASLVKSTLAGTDFWAAILLETNFCAATIWCIDFSFAELVKANLRQTKISYTNFANAILAEANFDKARLTAVRFGSVDLREVKGLVTVKHEGPSTIGIDTIYLSEGNIPEAFLKGAGVPDTFMEYMRSLIFKPIDYYTCFISYSSKDQAFAERLHADLQSKGVRCWFAPHDMKIGDRIRPRIDETIRIYDKLLLVLSQNSVASDWVEFEVEAALDKERKSKSTVLFPIRIDKDVMESETAWAVHIKRTRNIGDFTKWKRHDDYLKAFERLLRDLKAETKPE